MSQHDPRLSADAFQFAQRAAGRRDDDAPFRIGLWRVAMVRPKGEFEVFEECDKLGFRAFVPTQQITYVRHGRVIETSQIVIPGYVFVCAGEVDWVEVQALDPVIRMLEQHGEAPPRAFPTGFIECWMLRDGMPYMQQKPDGRRTLRPGMKVRLKGGPWDRQITFIHSIDKKDRIRVLMRVLGAQRPVPLGPDVEVEVLDGN